MITPYDCFKKAKSELSACIQSTLGKIDGLTAAIAGMTFFKFIGKNFFFLPAFGAFAHKRFQIFELFVSRAMLWCCHNDLLLNPRIIVCIYFKANGETISTTKAQMAKERKNLPVLCALVI